MQVTGLPPTLLPEKEKATEIPLPDVGAGAAPVPVPVGGPEHEPQFQLETFLDTSAKFHPSTFTRLPSAYFGRGIALADCWAFSRFYRFYRARGENSSYLSILVVPSASN